MGTQMIVTILKKFSILDNVFKISLYFSFLQYTTLTINNCVKFLRGRVAFTKLCGQFSILGRICLTAHGQLKEKVHYFIPSKSLSKRVGSYTIKYGIDYLLCLCVDKCKCFIYKLLMLFCYPSEYDENVHIIDVVLLPF
eukprot:TRINITY_DN4679_c0_g1_i11.p3 TRINITY_DN4679_c0_g1~~TRINITY_DN4679_c0_g1_i11.p3  ORF type:complete len:139 (-),score=0.50 TRINITY_DN4679_c0_g1_i11:43-459(-)